MSRSSVGLIWQEVIWPRPFELDSVLELLTHLAGSHLNTPITWEVRGIGGKIHYLIGVAQDFAGKLKDVLTTHGNIRFGNAALKRQDVLIAKQLSVSHPTLSLKTDNSLALARAALAAMAQTNPEETIALQIIIGAPYSPSTVPNKVPDPHTSWLNVILGNVSQASNESRNSLKEKASHHGFSCLIRLGANGQTETANARIRNLLSGLRMLESAGVNLNLKPEKALSFNDALSPWHYPLRLSVKELTNFFLLPVGEEELPGITGLHPKQILPPHWLKNSSAQTDSGFALSPNLTSETGRVRLSISARDSLEHTILLGPTGSGKSNVMLSLIMDSIKSGRSVLVIDPKSDLINDVLCRIPEERVNDVVVIDPSDVNPVGFNPFSLTGNQNPELVADAVLAVLKEIFADSWGIRTQDILSGALLTLTKVKNTSLILLPALLTNDQFRQKIIKGIDDKIGLEPFWAGYEAMSATERSQVIAPVLNKMRQFLLRPGLRKVLGQSEPAFSLSDLFSKRRIVLVPLNKGIVGAESARLLGSLIVGLTWTLALNRAQEASVFRQVVNVYIDELQDYLSLPTDLSDALAQARGLGVGLTLAHQYRHQLTPAIRAGIDTNARNKIVFGINSGDAKDIAEMAPELKAIDFMMLPRYHVYTTLQVDGKSTGWISGQTLPPKPAFRPAAEIKATSMQRYGRDASLIEIEYLAAFGFTEDKNEYSDSPDGKKQMKDQAPGDNIGRKKRNQI